jgi:hypothetical protein
MTKIICITLLLFPFLSTTCSESEVHYQNLSYPGNDHVIAYPNPFRYLVTLGVGIHKPRKVVLSVSDKNGKLIKYVDAALDSGYHQYTINFSNQSAGLYVCEAMIDDKIERINLYHAN